MKDKDYQRFYQRETTIESTTTHIGSGDFKSTPSFGNQALFVHEQQKRRKFEWHRQAKQGKQKTK